MDPINNEISTAIVMNNVAEDVSPLLLVGDEVIAGTIVVESFEIDCVVASDIKLSATTSVDETLKVNCVVKLIRLLVMETLLDSIVENIKRSTVVLVILLSSDFSSST